MNRAKQVLEALRHSTPISTANFDLHSPQAIRHKEIVDGITFEFVLEYFPKDKFLEISFSREMNNYTTLDKVETDPRTALKVFKIARNYLIPNADRLWKMGELKTIGFSASAEESSRVKFYTSAAKEIARHFNGTLKVTAHRSFVLFEINVGSP